MSQVANLTVCAFHHIFPTMSRMDVPEHDLREFIRLWQDEFGEALSLGDAHIQATQLLRLYSLLMNSPVTSTAPEPANRTPPLCAISSTAENQLKRRTDKSSPSNPSDGKSSVLSLPGRT